jgi:hypothetical protein
VLLSLLRLFCIASKKARELAVFGISVTTSVVSLSSVVEDDFAVPESTSTLAGAGCFGCCVAAERELSCLAGLLLVPVLLVLAGLLAATSMPLSDEAELGTSPAVDEPDADSKKSGHSRELLELSAVSTRSARAASDWCDRWVVKDGRLETADCLDSNMALAVATDFVAAVALPPDESTSDAGCKTLIGVLLSSDSVCDTEPVDGVRLDRNVFCVCFVGTTLLAAFVRCDSNRARAVATGKTVSADTLPSSTAVFVDLDTSAGCRCSAFLRAYVSLLRTREASDEAVSRRCD